MKKTAYSLIISLLIFCCIGWSFRVIAATYDPIVENTQQRLTELGYDPGPVDGKMGRKTENAIRKFQEDNNLSVTGKVDEETIQKLGLGSQTEEPEKEKAPEASKEKTPEVAQEKLPVNPNIEIDTFYPTQNVCGKSKEIEIVGKGFSAISSIEIAPAEHIQVKEIKEVELSEWQKSQDMKAWTIVVFAEKDAQPGERSVVLVTPEGRSQPETLTIVPYVPEITDVKILSTESYNCEVEMVLSIFYEGKKLDSDFQVQTRINCGGYATFTTGRSPDNVSKKGEKEYAIHAKFTTGQPNSSCSGPCVLTLWVKDKNDYRSDAFDAGVEFK